MKNVKQVIWKTFSGLFFCFFLMGAVTLRVNAQMETQTAGSSLGKEVEDTDGRVTADEGKARSLAGWKENEMGKWYEYSDGSYPVSSWRKIDGLWYYFDADGYLVEDNSHEEGSIKGIDVSQWQGDINWQAVKNDGIEYAFIRLGYGSQKLDTYYQKNMKNANQVGLPVGVYYYSMAQSEGQAILDAQFVIENLSGYTVSYPVVIDLEDSSQIGLGKTQIGKIAKAFCDEIRLAGYMPMLYCNEYWYTSCIDVSQIPDVELWIARYSYTYNDSISRDIWQCCNTGRVNGIYGNVDINFGYVDYTDVITPRSEAASGYYYRTGTWKEDGTGWWYQYLKGGYPENKWEKIGGKWYWFDSRGYMVTGWIKQNGIWYYLSENGIMVTGWKQIDEIWYYFNSSGAMVTGWIKSSDKWYYLRADGAMATGWIESSGKWYYLGTDGVMVTSWNPVDGITYYCDENGAMVTGWRKIDDNWYYFRSSGAMATGWIRLSGIWYYLDPSTGIMVTGWLPQGGHTYYLNPSSGAMLTGWQKIDGEWYYFNGSGYLQTGWQKINNAWYLLDSKTGIMVTGWSTDEKENTYYLNPSSGAMVTGWQKIEGYDYYFNASGVLQKDTWIGNYYVDESGRWIPGKTQ